MNRIQSNYLRAAALLLCAAFMLLPLGGCSGDPTGKIFRYDINGDVTNLDPQFSTDHGARIVLDNLFEGLVAQSPDGDIIPAVAKSWQVSADNLTYTFHLREDARWSNGDIVTAVDFVFTFQRLFRDDSPHAGKFLAVANAKAVQEGTAGISTLGVHADGAHQLVISLEYADPLFLTMLADPAAAPCNERVFSTSRGRYGLEEGLVCSNGPFALYSWSATMLQLRQSEYYQSERSVLAGGVNFYTGRDAAAQFLDGKTDVALLSREQQESLPNNAETRPIERTVWCIVFNQDHATWGNALLRQGLALAINHELMGENVPASFKPATLFVPEAMRVMGKPYRPSAFVETPMEFDTQRAMRLFDLGLEAKGLRELPPNTTILIPEDAKTQLNMGELQQGWQKVLSAYVNFETYTAAEVQRRLYSGEYQMLVMPMSPANADVETLLGAFRSDSNQNYFGYRSAVYDSLLDSAAAQNTPTDAIDKYAQAEKQLLIDATVIPLYSETSYLALANGVRDLEVSPFGDHVYFKYALKDR